MFLCLVTVKRYHGLSKFSHDTHSFLVVPRYGNRVARDAVWVSREDSNKYKGIIILYNPNPYPDPNPYLSTL